MNTEDYLRLFRGIHKRIDNTYDRVAIAIMQEMAKDSRMVLIEKEGEKAKQEAGNSEADWLFEDSWRYSRWSDN